MISRCVTEREKTSKRSHDNEYQWLLWPPHERRIGWLTLPVRRLLAYMQNLIQETDVALVNLGLDSMVLAELVEMLKFKYAAEVPEQWIYFESTTIQQVQVAVRNGGVSEDEVKEGQILEVKTEQKNQLLETCPCFLMCCPGLVLGRR